jgi:Glyoxalase/Bleomycin resistance protein/Dioxygenase superfamily
VSRLASSGGSFIFTNFKSERRKRVTWREMQSKKGLLPGYPGRLLQRGLSAPLNLVQTGGVLYAAPVDHVAIVMSERKVRRWTHKLKRVHGLPPIEPLHLWPVEMTGCPEVPRENHTVMASFQADGFRVVLLAPANAECVLARHLQKAGEGLHHVAFAMHDIEATTQQLGDLGLRQITELAADEPEMKQVFFKQDPDPRIVELVERAPNFTGTFACGNLQTLIEGERRNAFSREPEPVLDATSAAFWLWY